MKRKTDLTAPAVLLVTLTLCAGVALAETYSRTVRFTAGAQLADRISGVRGQPVTLGAGESGHAIYGLFSVERRDNPCYVAVRSESLNDSSSNNGTIQDYCGGKATSKEMGAAFENSMVYGPRVFMTGIRVCMNRDDTRVKGLQIRGKRINDSGVLEDLAEGSSPGSSGRVSNTPEPRDWRPNCPDDGWKKWVDCPEPNQVVTAVVAHFETGSTPRSLTGVELQCRSVGL